MATEPLQWKAAPFTVDNTDENTGRIVGYGSVFDVLDSQRDVVDRGAFSKSLAAHEKAGTRVKMLWEHYQPIGVWDAVSEDKRGLKVSGLVLKDDVRQAREGWALAKAGVVDGLSIGYRVPAGGAYQDEKGVRHLTSIDLVEVSLVMEPSNPRARVSGVKTVRDLEQRLRDAGFSRREAKAVASSGFRGLTLDDEAQRDADATDESALADLVTAIAAVTASMRD